MTFLDKSLVSLIAFCVLSCGPMIKPMVYRVGDQTAVVAASLPGTPEEIKTIVGHSHLRTQAIAPKNFGFLPQEHFEKDNLAFQDPSGDRRNNPEMERYLALSPELRKDDLYLDNMGDFFWKSEYHVLGIAVPFTCSFVLHLEPDGPERTRVDVLEFQPRIKVGWEFASHAFAHGPPGFVDSYRIVPPTTRDRVELLEQIQSTIPADPNDRAALLERIQHSPPRTEADDIPPAVNAGVKLCKAKIGELSDHSESPESISGWGKQFKACMKKQGFDVVPVTPDGKRWMLDNWEDLD
jgi:hypothetical protein